MVENGSINSKGTHEELLAMNGLYKEMWQAHMSVKDVVTGGAENV